MGQEVTTPLKTAKGVLGGTIGAGVGALSSFVSWRGRVADGENPLVAGIKEGAQALIYMRMGLGPGTLVLGGFALAAAGASAAYDFNKRQSVYMRQVRAPFSHSFSHTDATLAAQQRGLAAINQGRGLVGSEAGIMNQLYGRR